MIGSVLFYVLYPLSRLFTGRASDRSKKHLPPAALNDKAVRDGGAVTTRSFTLSQTKLLDQWSSSCSGMEAETKERMIEPNLEREDNRTPHTEEQPTPLLQEDSNSEATSGMSKIQIAKREHEGVMGNGHQRDNMEGPRQESGDETDHHEVLHVKQISQDVNHLQIEVFTSEKSHLEDLKPVDSTLIRICQMQEKVETQNFEDPAPRAKLSVTETINPIQVQIQTARMEESTSPAETAAKVTECWDEYLLPVADGLHCGESSSERVFASPLSHSEIYLKFSEQQPHTQSGWHFPAGLGLAEEVHCPLWQFPAVSYYPPLEPAAPFEVMWRVWEDVDESASAADPALTPLPFTNASMDFTVMSYNILAQDLLEANQELYTHCPLEVLDWSYRCKLLIEEILKWAPDILCLQEVQENHYHEQLYPVLSEMGYTCTYKRRTGTKTDGCATCYRSSRFSELSVTLLEFFRPETELLDRHNIGIVLLLRPVVTKGAEVKAKGPPLCVANTHLLFNPRRGDVKLTQLAILLAEIDSVFKSCKAKGEHCNLILCGDFNSLPHTSLYQLITTGELYFHGLPTWMISGQEDLSYKVHCRRLLSPLWPSCLEITDCCQYTTAKRIFEDQKLKAGKCQFSHDFLLQLRFCPAACVRPLDLELIPGVTDNTPDSSSRKDHTYEKRFRHTISHQFDLESVYKHTLPGSGNPEVTTLHAEGGATVDYIFYTPRRVLPADPKGGGYPMTTGLKLIGSLTLLSEDLLWSIQGLPSHVFPSDHLSLLAKFQLELNAT